MRFKLFVFFFICSKFSHGQFGLSDTIYKEINKLRTTEYDTVIQFGLPSYTYPHFDTLAGIGKVTNLNTEYLIYKKSDLIFIRKYVNYTDEKDNDFKVLCSMPLQVERDSTIDLVFNCVTQVENEQIDPYVYSYKFNGYLHYYELKTTHEPQWTFGIFTLNNDLVKVIGSMGLKENYNNFPKNLNYLANQATLLKTVFIVLSEYIERNDTLFKFAR